MPIYFYKCPAGHQNEVEMKMDDYVDEVDCPEEGCSEKAKRNFTGQNVLGIVEGGTRGGVYKLRKSYGAKD